MKSIVDSVLNDTELCTTSDTFIIRKGDQVIKFLKSTDPILVEEINSTYKEHLSKNA